MVGRKFQIFCGSNFGMGRYFLYDTFCTTFLRARLGRASFCIIHSILYPLDQVTVCFILCHPLATMGARVIFFISLPPTPISTSIPE